MQYRLLEEQCRSTPGGLHATIRDLRHRAIDRDSTSNPGQLTIGFELFHKTT